MSTQNFQGTRFSSVSIEDWTRTKHSLPKLRALVDAVLASMSEELKMVDARRGYPSAQSDMRPGLKGAAAGSVLQLQRALAGSGPSTNTLSSTKASLKGRQRIEEPLRWIKSQDLTHRACQAGAAGADALDRVQPGAHGLHRWLEGCASCAIAGGSAPGIGKKLRGRLEGCQRPEKACTGLEPKRGRVHGRFDGLFQQPVDDRPTPQASPVTAGQE